MLPQKMRFKTQFLSVFTCVLLGLTASGCSLKKNYQEFVSGLWHKIDHLARADQLNEHLEAEVARLEAENLRLKRKLRSFEETARANRIHKEAVAEGGIPEARTEKSLVPELFDEHRKSKRSPASVNHDVHGGSEEEALFSDILSAPPKKIFEQALQALNRQEYDRAARGFVALAKNKHNTRFATSQVHFYAGLSLYRMNNFKKAAEYLEHSHRLALNGEGGREYAPKSLAWLALCHKKLGNAAQAQRVVRNLVETYPESAEARSIR